jgi:acylphosphatase
MRVCGAALIAFERRCYFDTRRLSAAEVVLEMMACPRGCKSPRDTVKFRVLRESGDVAKGTDGEVARLYLVSGAVQGVGYRYFAMRAAQQLAVRGTVKNLRDGRVEVAAAADAGTMAAFRAELERGPKGAVVSGIEEQALADGKTFGDEFTIEYER